MPQTAEVVKLVDAGDSKSPAARRAGSIPAFGTTIKPVLLHAVRVSSFQTLAGLSTSWFEHSSTSCEDVITKYAYRQSLQINATN
jgi:hypothetical protein